MRRLITIKPPALRVRYDLKQRLEQHKKGQVYYTKNKLPVKLVYFEACLNSDDACRRERYLKTGMGKRYLRNRLKGGLTG